MHQLQTFNFQRNDIRTLLVDETPYFVAKDVTNILGYSNSRDAISRHVDDEDKDVVKLDTLGGKQSQSIITESGVYSLIFSSKLPAAKQFKHWVTSEVLPALREKGSYSTQVPQSLPEALRLAADQAEKIQEMKPKALFADSVSTSESTILVGELAKILRGNGVEIGSNRLFVWLRNHGYLIKRKGTDYNMPTQKSMNLGLFKIKETTINHSDGSVGISKTPKVTGKGQQYFINKFIGGNYAD